jgi:glycine cleavage system H lipoate-binding protein
MKTNYGDIWCETQPDGMMSIGFTKKCIEEKLCECFHILPADVGTAKLKQPLLVLETNDGVEAIPSPINGRIIIFSEKAKNFPDRMTEEDVVVSIEPPEVTARKMREQAKAKPKVTAKVVDNAPQQQYVMYDWPAVQGWGNGVAQAAPVQPQADNEQQRRINDALARLRRNNQNQVQVNPEPFEFYDPDLNER